MNRKTVSGIMLTLSIVSTLCLEFNVVSLATGGTPEEEPIPSHFLNRTGTYFELNDSEYLNVTITSTSTVHVVLSAPPEMIDYLIQSADGSNSTTLTLGNLQPSTTYYMYEDSYMNEVVFTTYSDGSYTYTQDLSQLHHVFIQPRSSTTFICENTTLTHDIYGSVQICANNIVLDLNGYSIIGTYTGYGVVCGKTGVTIKNGTIKVFTFGISLGSGNRVDGNTICNCFIGIISWGGRYNTISGNNIRNCRSHGIGMSMYPKGNEIYGNMLSNNGNCGIHIGFSRGNKIFHNNFIDNKPYQARSWFAPTPDVWDDGYPSGGNYWCDYGGDDLYGGPYQNVAGSDGIGDTAYYGIYGSITGDRYPLMSPWTPAATVEEVEVTRAGQTYPVLLVSNSTIANIRVTRNSLHFDVSGPEGTLAYVSAVLPIGLNTTKIKVFLNGTKLTPPPYPVITRTSTHYFLYFAVTFTSIYDVAILFAPITATVDQKQDTLNLGSEGTYVTVYIELPEGYDVSDIDISSILLNDTIPVDPDAPTEIGDYDNDCIPDLMFKFDRAEVISYVLMNTDIEGRFMAITLIITGELNDGTPFQGNDTIKIIMPILGRSNIIPI